MKTFVKCKICNTEIPAAKCAFASHKKVIDGKEYVFCCARCAEDFEKNKE